MRFLALARLLACVFCAAAGLRVLEEPEQPASGEPGGPPPARPRPALVLPHSSGRGDALAGVNRTRESRVRHADVDVGECEFGGTPRLASSWEDVSREELAPGTNAWTSYRKFHLEGRQALKDGETRPLIVWRCVTGESCGGNGDQVKGLLTTFYFAVQTKRLFFVEWERYNFSIAKLLTPSYIDWRLPESLNCKGETRAEFFGRKWFEDDAWEGTSCVFIRSNAETLRKKAAAASLSKYRPGCAFHYLFQPSSELLALVDQRHPAGLVGKSYYAVHLRFGDNRMIARSTNERIGESSQVLAEALQCVRSIEGQELLPVLVYTDDFRVKSLAVDPNWLAKNAGGQRVNTTKGENGQPFMPAHTDTRKPDGQLGGPQSSVINAWADQWGLASAAGVVQTRSGFSRWAIEMGMMRPEAVKTLKIANGHATCLGHKYIGW